MGSSAPTMDKYCHQPVNKLDALSSAVVGVSMIGFGIFWAIRTSDKWEQPGDTSGAVASRLFLIAAPIIFGFLFVTRAISFKLEMCCGVKTPYENRAYNSTAPSTPYESRISAGQSTHSRL